MGGDAVYRTIQLGLNCGMALNQVTPLRTRLALQALNVFARAINRKPRHTPTASTQNENVARILVIELWNIGDVILVMPFLAQLRYSFPRAKIALLARPFAVELLAGTGLVDEYIAADLTWTSADRGGPLKRAIEVWQVSRKLRSQKFDIAFSSRLHLREHVLLALSGARRRVGFFLNDGDGALTDPIQGGAEQRHKVEDWMRLLQPFGGTSSVEVPPLHVTESERMWAKGYLASSGVRQTDLLIGIHPGASLAEKRWPLQQFREVAAAMAGQRGIRVLVFAEPSGYGSELFAVRGVISAQVGLRELVALIARCNLLVCNDSGPMHIAGALGVPTVAMFGQGIEKWFAPLGEGHELLRPHEDKSSADSRPRDGGIRAPAGIQTSQVLDAVGRAVQRVRAGRTFSSL